MLDNSHSTLGEGTDAGIIGGLAVAIWFLILDTIAGHPFQTPSLLGQVVLFGDSQPDTAGSSSAPYWCIRRFTSLYSPSWEWVW